MFLWTVIPTHHTHFILHTFKDISLVTAHCLHHEKTQLFSLCEFKVFVLECGWHHVVTWAWSRMLPHRKCHGILCLLKSCSRVMNLRGLEAKPESQPLLTKNHNYKPMLSSVWCMTLGKLVGYRPIAILVRWAYWCKLAVVSHPIGDEIIFVAQGEFVPPNK